MTAAVRRAWRKTPAEMPFAEVMRQLRAFGCTCTDGPLLTVLRTDGSTYQLSTRGIDSDFYASVVVPNVPGGGHRPRYAESHRCRRCGIGFRRTEP